MTDDDHAVRLRGKVKATFHEPENCEDGNPGGCDLLNAYDQAIRYHEAKARVEALRGVEVVNWVVADQAVLDALSEAEAAIAAIVVELEADQ